MLAIIPARGGSKGLPGKNIKMLAGKPMIAYTVEAALKSKNITQVIVSTEDNKIAEVAKEYGAEVPFMRPSELASDTALSIDTYLYTLDKLANEFEQKHDEFLVLQPTSPLRNAENIDKAIELFETKNADSVIGYCEEHHPISWHKYMDSEGKLSTIFGDEKLANRQDLKRTFYPNGALFIFKTSIIKRREYYTDKTFAYLMDRKDSVDIDTIDDFEYAEYLMNKRNERK